MTFFAVKVYLFLCSIIVIFEPFVAPYPDNITRLPLLSPFYSSLIHDEHDRRRNSDCDPNERVSKLADRTEDIFGDSVIQELIKKHELTNMKTTVDLEKTKEDLYYNTNQFIRLLDDARGALKVYKKEFDSLDKKQIFMIFSGYGAPGFISAYIALHLKKLDYKVIVVSYPSSKGTRNFHSACDLINIELENAKYKKEDTELQNIEDIRTQLKTDKGVLILFRVPDDNINAESKVITKPDCKEMFERIRELGKNCKQFLEGHNEGAKEGKVATDYAYLDQTSTLLKAMSKEKGKNIVSIGLPLENYFAHSIITFNFPTKSSKDTSITFAKDIKTYVVINQRFWDNLDDSNKAWMAVKDRNSYTLGEIYENKEKPTHTGVYIMKMASTFNTRSEEMQNYVQSYNSRVTL